MTWLIKDTRGAPSWTMTLSIPIVVLLTIKFLISGISITAPNNWSGAIPAMSGSDYAMATGIWLGFFSLREWRERRPKRGEA